MKTNMKRTVAIKSLSLEEKIWAWIDTSAAKCGMGRTAFVQEVIAGVAGLKEFERPKITVKDLIHHQ